MPQIFQNDTFCTITFIHPLDFSETLPDLGDKCYERTIGTADPGKTLVRVPRELLGLKTPIWGLLLTFVQNVIMYVFIVVYYGAEFKFTGPNT